MPRTLLLLPMIVACAPPPAVDGVGSGAVDPAVEIIFPPADVGTIALTDTPDGPVLDLFLVADVEGLLYVSPLENKEDVEGEGHYHFNVNGVYEDAPPARHYRWQSDPGEFSEGDRLQVSVTLASNTHRDLDTFENWIDVIEFNVGAPEPDTDAGDTDG